MKKAFIYLLLPCTLLLSGCDVSKIGNYLLTEKDAAAAIRQLLQIGANAGNDKSIFSRDNIMKALFPEDVNKVINTIHQLGLSGEVDRFMNTMGTAAENTAVKSIPVFETAITNLTFSDAIAIVRGNNNAATDFLRMKAGDELRRAITPVMETALNEYNLNKQWQTLVKPLKALLGNRINLDLSNLMAGMVTEAMFKKIGEQEVLIRTQVSARTTSLLKRVFGVASLQ